MTATRDEMIEYIGFKLDDEGVEGVAEHCVDYVREFDPELAERIVDWYVDGALLLGELRSLVEGNGGAA